MHFSLIRCDAQPKKINAGDHREEIYSTRVLLFFYFIRCVNVIEFSSCCLGATGICLAFYAQFFWNARLTADAGFSVIFCQGGMYKWTVHHAPAPTNICYAYSYFYGRYFRLSVLSMVLCVFNYSRMRAKQQATRTGSFNCLIPFGWASALSHLCESLNGFHRQTRNSIFSYGLYCNVLFLFISFDLSEFSYQMCVDIFRKKSTFFYCFFFSTDTTKRAPLIVYQNLD